MFPRGIEVQLPVMNGLASWESFLRYFVHFYAWGTVWNYLLLYMFVTECLMGEQLAGVPVLGLWPILARLDLSVSNCCSVVTLHCVEVLLVLVMVCCQVTRRLYECLFVSVFSESSMHVIHYLLGFFFYTALGPTALQHLHGETGLALQATCSFTEGISLCN